MFGMSDLILIVISLTALILSWLKDPRRTKSAMKISVKSFVSVFPFLMAVFALIGLLEVFVSRQMIVSVMGSSRGILAPVFAAVTGGILAGPPAASYPLASFLLKQQASPAAVATFIIAWVSVSTVSLPLEIKLFGQRFAFSRWGITFLFSIVIGIILGWLI